MTTYYVRTAGSDENDGLSPAAAFLTIDKAANTVAAGDVVYVGSGVYRELVTMDTSGTSGSVISFIGDVTGRYTGDAGLVIISAHDSPYEPCTRVFALDLNYQQFLTFQNLTFEGGTTAAVGHTDGTTDTAYEAVTFQTCVIVSGEDHADRAVRLKLNYGVTPTGDYGLRFLGCRFVGEARFDNNGQETAHINIKAVFQNCYFRGRASGSNLGIVWYGTTGTTYTIGGVTIEGCVFDGCAQGVAAYYMKNTTDPIVVRNCLMLGCGNPCYNSASTATPVIIENVITWACGGNGGTVPYLSTAWPAVSFPHVGGLSDLAWYANMGWSPYAPLEPMSPSPALGFGAGTLTSDQYGNPRPQAGSLAYFFLNGSDVAVSDPNDVWGNEANAFDGNLANRAYTDTAGDTASNFLVAEGTSAPPSGGTIGQVRARIYGLSLGTATISATFYTDALGEELGTATNDLAAAGWGDWAALTAPTGGWTWAALQALGVKVYRNAGTARVYVYCVQLEVTASVSDLGPVEARNRPTLTGGAFTLSGAGFSDFFVAVDAVETTISVSAQYDANYTGDLPLLEVFNIPGDTDKSDAMTAAAATPETLSVTFTPTAAGQVRVRLRSRDTSVTGTCSFSDLARA